MLHEVPQRLEAVRTPAGLGVKALKGREAVHGGFYNRARGAVYGDVREPADAPPVAEGDDVYEQRAAGGSGLLPV